MPLCSNCGTEVAANAAFCFSCGAERKEAAEAPPMPEEAVESEVEEPWVAEPEPAWEPAPEPSPAPVVFEGLPVETSGTSVPNYLAGSIVVSLCCCLPGGLVSLVFASQANSKASQGLYDEAMKAANVARITLIASVLLGLAVSGMTAVLMVIGAAAGG